MPAPTEPEPLVLFEASPTPMLLVDHEEGVIIDANPAASRFYGFGPDQMRGMPVATLSASAPERVRDIAQQTEARAVRFTVEHRLATGETVPVDVAAAPVHVRGRRLVHSVIRPASETAAEERLAAVIASERRYRDLVEHLGAGVARFGPDGRPTWANATLAEMLGYPDEEALLAAGDTVLADGEATRWSEACLAEIRAAGAVRLDLEMRRRDGERVVGEMHARLLPDGTIEAVIHDVTAAREAQAALARNETRTRRLVESAQDQVVELDSAGRIAYANPAAARDTGFAAEELVGRDAMDLVDPRDRPGLLAPRDEILAGGAAVREYRLLRADGTSTWVEARSHALPDGGAETIARVIDERKALEAERDRLAVALDQSLDLVLLTDPSAVTLYVNRALERLAGVDRADVVGRSALAWGMGGVVDPEGVMAARDALRATGQWTGDLRLRRVDGSEIVLAARVSRIHDALGEPVAILAIASDVTRERAQAERLAEVARSEAIGRLAGAIAHDFNNLLTGVLGYAQLAATAPAGDPSLAEDLGGLVEAARRAELLTRQLLAFGRRSILRPRAVDPAAVILGIEPALRRLAGDRVRVAIESAGMASAWIDPGLLEVATVGLVENARDAMPGGGSLRIEVGPPDALDDAPAGTWTAVRVSDTGRGMSPDELDRVLDPAYSTKQPAGMGLGLPMVNGFMEQSGGRLRVVSAPGVGTTVTLLLPGADMASAPAAAPEAPTGAAAGVGTGTRTILVVDDEPVLRAIAERVLAQAGYRVIVAASGDEALGIALDPNRSVDLLFTDIVMPGMQGTALARTVRGATPHLPVLLTSGYTAEEMDSDGALGGHAFLPKPYRPSDLVATVTRLLEDRADATRVDAGAAGGGVTT